MTFRFLRSLKRLPAMRLNLGKRGIGTSIGPRRALVNESRIRTAAGPPASGLSYMHMGESRVVGCVAPDLAPSPNSVAPTDIDRRGLFWIALIVLAIAAAAEQLMT